MQRYINLDKQLVRLYRLNLTCEDVVKEFLLSAETVNVPDRKVGEWVNDKGLYRCSACNELWLDWWAITVPIDEMNKKMKFCPNCGSFNGKVGGGEDA